MKSLTAADRSALIRLASTLEKGSTERKAILAGLGKMARMPSMVLNDPEAYLRGARKTWEYNVNNPRLKFDAAVEKTRKKNRLPDTPEGRAEAAYHEITLLQG